MAINLKYLIDADEMTPEERLERFIDLMAQAVVRMIKDGEISKNAEAEDSQVNPQNSWYTPPPVGVCFYEF